jgi:hypothetical protein
LLPRFRELAMIFSLFDDTMLLLGSDLFFNSISFYRGLKAMAQIDAPGAKVVFEDLKSRYPGHSKNTTP